MNTYTSLDIFCDGGARGNPGKAAVGVVIKSGSKVVAAFGRAIGEATNNVAEYQGVIAAWEFLQTQKIRAKTMRFFLDSTLVARQLAGLYKIKQEHLRKLFLHVKLLEQKVGGQVSYTVIPREQNQEADFEVNQALDQSL